MALQDGYHLVFQLGCLSSVHNGASLRFHDLANRHKRCCWYVQRRGEQGDPERVGRRRKSL